ncbi:MAG: hypothetical protein HZB11_03185 [Candidatus Yonathbacteria bacterium]|nr:hypothetical protein [Candidatus Yonathbacteria bacterium]
MKILAPFEKLFTPYALIAFNLAIIFGAGLVGGGTFFAKTGLVHAIAFLFVALIIVRIFSDYAFSDHILKGFLKIQLAFFLFLGFIHIYEYLGLIVFPFNDEVVELSAMGSYLLWILGALLSFEFVFRIYYKKTFLLTAILSVILAVGFAMLLAVNLSSAFAESLSEWLPLAMLASIAVFGIGGILSIRKIRDIMPVFLEYSYYAIPAGILVVLTAFSEYFESTGYLQVFGISQIQNLYISHFLIYAALSLLLIGFGKLKKPRGIYSEM